MARKEWRIDSLFELNAVFNPTHKTTPLVKYQTDMLYKPAVFLSLSPHEIDFQVFNQICVALTLAYMTIYGPTMTKKYFCSFV